MAAVLACLSAIPAAFWLADEGLVPWAEELRWEKLRATDEPSRPMRTGVVELSRSGCFGRCPVYSLRLSTTGRVDFEGFAYVCEPGVHVAQVSAAAAQDLIADIAAAGFFDLRWNQGNLIADASDSSVSLEYGGQRRSLPSIDADSNAPRLLRRISSAIDGVAGTRRWLPSREGRKLTCANGRDVGDEP